MHHHIDHVKHSIEQDIHHFDHTGHFADEHTTLNKLKLWHYLCEFDRYYHPHKYAIEVTARPHNPNMNHNNEHNDNDHNNENPRNPNSSFYNSR